MIVFRAVTRGAGHLIGNDVHTYAYGGCMHACTVYMVNTCMHHLQHVVFKKTIHLILDLFIHAFSSPPYTIPPRSKAEYLGNLLARSRGPSLNSVLRFAHSPNHGIHMQPDQRISKERSI